MFAEEQFLCLEVLFSVLPLRRFRIHVLHVRPVFLPVMCSQMQNVNVTPLTAPESLSVHKRPVSDLLFGALHFLFFFLHEEV